MSSRSLLLDAARVLNGASMLLTEIAKLNGAPAAATSVAARQLRRGPGENPTRPLEHTHGPRRDVTAPAPPSTQIDKASTIPDTTRATVTHLTPNDRNLCQSNIQRRCTSFHEI